MVKLVTFSVSPAIRPNAIRPDEHLSRRSVHAAAGTELTHVYTVAGGAEDRRQRMIARKIAKRISREKSGIMTKMERFESGSRRRLGSGWREGQ